MQEESVRRLTDCLHKVLQEESVHRWTVCLPMLVKKFGPPVNGLRHKDARGIRPPVDGLPAQGFARGIRPPVDGLPSNVGEKVLQEESVRQWTDCHPMLVEKFGPPVDGLRHKDARGIRPPVDGLPSNDARGIRLPVDGLPSYVGERVRRILSTGGQVSAKMGRAFG
ncbi:uncharacterized protein LOC120429889 [Culex pipiens pallens]|uniref:uncharacterized protein LOC120429889 n=1 Tax=Culex pipiens pallens TaxID=42434 RepID=UPI001952BFFE|nr:uncharacterized protein LOC120429889 [Culex pipiens pallens]